MHVPIKRNRQACRKLPIWLALAAITAAGAVLRSWQAGESLWLDELHTAWAVSGGWEEIARRAAAGNHSPAYFLLPWMFAQGLGLSEASLRAPSILAGAALIPATYLAARWLVRWPPLGLFAAFLAAIDPRLVLFSLEARPYALVQLVGVFHLLLLWRATRRPTWPVRSLWVLTGALLIYLHFTAVLLLAAEIVFLAAVALRERMRDGPPIAYRPRQAALDVAVMALLCLPAAPQLMRIASHRDDWALFIPRPDLAAAVTIFPLWLYVLAPLAASAVGLLARMRGEKPPLRRPAIRAMLLVGCWLVVPVGLAWLLSATDVARLFHLRYLMVAAPALPLLAVLILALPRRRWERWIALAAMAVIVLAVEAGGWRSGCFAEFVRHGRFVLHTTENWRDAVAYVDQHAAPGDPIFVQSNLIEADRLGTDHAEEWTEYCLLPVRNGLYAIDAQHRPIAPLRTTAPFFPAAARAQLAAAGGASHLWLVVRRPSPQPRALLELKTLAAVSGRGPHHVERHDFGGVQVFRLRPVSR